MVGSSNDQLSRPTRIIPLVTYVGTGQDTLKKTIVSPNSVGLSYIYTWFITNLFQTLAS